MTSIVKRQGLLIARSASVLTASAALAKPFAGAKTQGKKAVDGMNTTDDNR